MTVPGQHVVVGQKRQLLWALVVSALTREGSGPFMDAVHRESLHIKLLFGFLPADTQPLLLKTHMTPENSSEVSPQLRKQ